MNTEEHGSVLLTGKSFARRKGFFFAKSSRSRGFAVNPELDFHREGAKHAKKTRRTLVWLRLCCSVFIRGSVHTSCCDWAGPCSSVSEPQDFIIVECENSFPALANDLVSDGEMVQRTGLRRNLRADRRRNRLGSPGHIRRA